MRERVGRLEDCFLVQPWCVECFKVGPDAGGVQHALERKDRAPNVRNVSLALP